MSRLFTALIVIGSVYGQEAVAPPILKRVPAKAAKRIQPEPVLIPAKTEKPDATIELIAPPKPVDDASILDAVSIGLKLREEPSMPSRGPDGRLTYTFGRGEPVLVCAPLRICLIDLQPGERIRGKPVIGNEEEWMVIPIRYGPEDTGIQGIIVKARHPAALETNIIVPTDRRVYYIRMVIRPNDYVARIAFRYPEDDVSRWAQAIHKTLPPPEPEVLPAIVATERLNFSYSVKGGDDFIRPQKVYDDGEKTFFQMPVGMAAREAPVLMVIGDDGKAVMSNYRVKQGTYILDRLIDRAQMVNGHGKKAKRVEIKRENRG